MEPHILETTYEYNAVLALNYIYSYNSIIECNTNHAAKGSFYYLPNSSL